MPGRRFPEEEAFRETRYISADRRNARGSRSILTRGRTAEAGVNVTQMTVAKFAQLRVLAVDSPPGAESGDIGKFVFVTGYSEVGGPDFIPS